MTRTLIAFHGFTMNGERMQSALGPLVAALEPDIRVVCLNAPHACSEASIQRMYAGASVKPPPPYLCWWNASDDGLHYHGWEETRDVVREALERYAPASVLGFSQGGILAAAVAALAHAGQLPAIHCAVLIAGRAPRAANLQAIMKSPIPLPSLHVWGERDRLTGEYAQELVERFSPDAREVVVWPGGHLVPTRGPAYDSLLQFVREHA